MSATFRVQITAADSNMDMVVQNSSAAEPAILRSRPPLELDGEAVERLMQGRASDNDVLQIQRNLREWLGDVIALLARAVDEARRSRTVLKVVFELDREAELFIGPDVPFELVSLTEREIGDQITSLVVDPWVNLCQKHCSAGEIQIPLVTRVEGPLRILLVHASPKDYDPIPSAQELVSRVEQLALEHGHNVALDVLSSEPGCTAVRGLPTNENLRKQIISRTQSPYDIFIFLGHSEVIPSGHPGYWQGVLILEQEDGRPERCPGRNFATWLSANPISVVLLIGCQTAAFRRSEPPGSGHFPPTSGGVFQAVVRKALVHRALGMRQQITRDDARGFLHCFLGELLGRQPEEGIGDVDSALCAARQHLFEHGRQPFVWAAPIVHSTDHPEPVLGCLLSRPTSGPDLPNVLQGLERIRHWCWEALYRLPLSLHNPPSPLVQNIHTILRQVCRDWEDQVTRVAVTLQPELATSTAVIPPNGFVMLTLNLRGPGMFHSVSGRVALREFGAAIVACRFANASDDVDYDLAIATVPTIELFFHLAQKPTALGAASIKAGPLLAVDIQLYGTALGIYEVDVYDLKLDSPTPIYPARCAIIVPQPWVHATSGSPKENDHATELL